MREEDFDSYGICEGCERMDCLNKYNACERCVVWEITTTLQDIQDNITELKRIAGVLVEQEQDEQDWWHNITIAGKDYDMNIFDWEDEDGSPLRIATVHPVIRNGSGFADTDMNNYVRLIEKKG